MAQSSDLDALNTRVLAAHAAGATEELMQLYERAALQLEAQGDNPSAMFFFTQAYVHALEFGNAEVTARLYEKLRAAGRVD